MAFHRNANFSVKVLAWRSSLSQLKLPINVHLRCGATLSTLDLEVLKPFVPDFFRWGSKYLRSKPHKRTP